MWAQYADSHKGVCLEIDKSLFLKENVNSINKEFLKEVVYNHLDLNGAREHISFDYSKLKSDVNYLEQFKFDNHKDLFFTKNAEWLWERETRLVHFSKSETKEYCSIKESLINIYTGIGFHDSYIPSLRNLISNQNIFKMEWNDVRLTPFLLK